MRNLTVGICVSVILAGCGGGGATPTPANSTTPTTPATPTTPPAPVVVKDPLKIVTGASYDAGDGGANPRWVISDFNKDGIKDIFLRYDPESAFTPNVDSAGSPVRFFLGKSDGGFTQSTSIFPEGYSPVLVNRIIVNDFNGDGGPDIAIAAAGKDPYLNGVSASSGHTGSYSQILTYSPNGYKLSKVTNNPLNFGHHVSAGDINGDYLPDALVTSMMYISAFFIMGDSNGNYKADTSRFASNVFNTNTVETFSDGTPKKWEIKRFTSTAMIDANNDGRMDAVLMAGPGTKTSVVYLNDGSGNFSNDKIMELPAGPYPAGYGYADPNDRTKSYYVGNVHMDTIVADVNGDGKPDIISLATLRNDSPAENVDCRGAMVQILINNGKGFTDETKSRVDFTYAPNKNYTHYESLEFADVNHDGCKDILIHRYQTIWGDSGNPTKILLNDCKGNFKEVPYPSVLPKGILTVIADGHYAVLVSEKNGSMYTQRVDDVYYDWSLGKTLFP